MLDIVSNNWFDFKLSHIVLDSLWPWIVIVY